MNWKRLNRLLLFIVLTLSVVAGVSHVWPVETSFHRGPARRFVVSLRNARVRVVRLAAELTEPHAGEGPFDKWGDGWTFAPCVIAVQLPGGTKIRQSVTDIRVWDAVAVAILPMIAISAISNRTRLLLVLREILRPSGRACLGRGRRLFVRVPVAVCTVLAILIVVAWTLGHSGTMRTVRATSEWGDISLGLYRGTFLHIGVPAPGGWRLDLNSYEGVWRTLHERHGSANTPLARLGFGLSVFAWPRRAALTVGPGRDQGVIPDAPRASLATPNGGVVIVTFPLWAPFVLFASWPVIVFIRGPWRRAGRRSDGSCSACGYNLTGNVSGVCPECGTEIKPAQSAHVSLPRSV